jgi:hypothetical protein
MYRLKSVVMDVRDVPREALFAGRRAMRGKPANRLVPNAILTSLTWRNFDVFERLAFVRDRI